MTSNMSSDFHFLVPESFHKNLVQFRLLVPEKKILDGILTYMGVVAILVM